jgi:uncharacterized protein (UPF0332 family)
MTDDELFRSSVESVWGLAQEKRRSALLLFRHGLFNDAVSRAYYSVFHAATLLFLFMDREFSSHKTLLGAFNKDFVRTGVMSGESGKALELLFDARQSGDYDSYSQIDRSEANEALDAMESFLAEVVTVIAKRFGMIVALDPALRDGQDGG